MLTVGMLTYQWKYSIFAFSSKRSRAQVQLRLMKVEPNLIMKEGGTAPTEELVEDKDDVLNLTI